MQDTAFQTQDCEETQTGMQLRLLYSKMPAKGTGKQITAQAYSNTLYN